MLMVLCGESLNLKTTYNSSRSTSIAVLAESVAFKEADTQDTPDDSADI